VICHAPKAGLQSRIEGSGLFESRDPNADVFVEHRIVLGQALSEPIAIEKNLNAQRSHASAS
jgi:hypothetical protein